MAEPGKAPVGTPKTITIKIDGQYNCDPPDGSVLDGGQVTFHVAPNNGCVVCTDPTNALPGADSNGCVSLVKGDNTFNIAVVDTTITYCACASGTCDPFKKTLSGGNTIKVESSMGGHSR